jgi:hypothetical protein
VSVVTVENGFFVFQGGGDAVLGVRTAGSFHRRGVGGRAAKAADGTRRFDDESP